MQQTFAQEPEVRLRNTFHVPYDDAIAAARTCYSKRVIDADEINDGQRARIGPLTYEGGHHTVYQHATFEFALSGISRQLAWCFLHNFPFYNTEQQSQRYVKLGEPSAYVPPELQGEARALYTRSIEDAWRAYAELTKRLEPGVMEVLSQLRRLPRRLNRGYADTVRREAGKKSIETARYVIPIACHTAMVYTVSGITLHRLRRMVSVGDAPVEARRVVDTMVKQVHEFDPDFFDRIGEPPYEADEVVEFQAAPPGACDTAALAAFDESLGGLRARLVDWSARGPEVVADAVRHVLGRPGLGDAEALELVLNPARNHYHLDLMNISFHSPLMRTLNHAHYTFRKKLSHTADSQDQRHRMVPGSRPLLTRCVPMTPDVVEPELIASDPACSGIFRQTVEAQWHARAELLRLGASPETALYVLPNALALRFEESGNLLHLLHKWNMRTCLNAQREIYEASMDEVEQVRALHPQLVKYVGPPCVVRNGLATPRCTEGSHFCGVPVWRSFPDVQRVI